MYAEKCETLSVLQGMYAAEAEYLSAGGPGTADFEILASFFSPDVVLHQAEALPYGGTWRGHDGLERFFVAMSRAWDVFEMVEQDFLATGRTAVVRTQVHARGRATGRELDFPILQTLETETGRITEVRPFYWDTAAIAAVCTSPMGSTVTVGSRSPTAGRTDGAAAEDQHLIRQRNRRP